MVASSSESQEIEWEFPEKLGFLFEPSRYKVAYGGRDGAKSWSFARALLLLGAEKPLRIGCFREVQRSIRESVHKLLGDQIQKLGLGRHYEVLQNEIRGAIGTEIVFAGLSTLTRESIKSYEGLDIGWIEEAQSVKKRSWDILIPTIRKPGSEIWASFNPELDTDDTYQRFVVKSPSNAVVVKINYDDNPWRSKVLDQERKDMERDAPDDFAHIYGGHCRAAVDGAIYYKEVSALRSSGRICNAPYNPMLKAHAIVDLGYDDYMSIIVAQRNGSELSIIDYVEDRLRYIPSYSEELKAMELNWGKMYLPHDGKAKHVTGKSAQEQFETLGWDVEIVPDIGLENGIKAARLIFPRCYFDKDKAGPLVNRLARYRRRVNQETNTGGAPVHDDNSHGADGFRYFSIIADEMSNDGMTVADPYAGFRSAYAG